METLDANIVGLRKLLEFYKHQNIDGLLMFSSSEIYGEPIPEQIQRLKSIGECGDYRPSGLL